MTNNLLAGAADTTVAASSNALTLDDLPDSYRELVVQAQAQLQPQQGAFEMFVDLPPDSPAQTPIVMVADATQARKPAGVQRTLGIYRPMENIQNDPVMGKVTISFAEEAATYLSYFEKNSSFKGGKATFILLQQPLHGQLIEQDNNWFLYKPNPDFHGQDKIVALVELGGYQVKVVYFIKVVNENTECRRR